MEHREIDLLIAEKVMGWNVEYFANIDAVDIYDEEGLKVDDFSPSTNIQDAWLVVENLSNAEYRKRTYGDKSSYNYIRTTITHSKKGIKVCVQTDGYSYSAESDNLPNAICEAVLKAVGVDING